MEIAGFIQVRHIDSFQKLRVLVFLHKHAELSWTSQQIAEQLYLGDGPLLEAIIAELSAAGLVTCVAGHYKLNDEVGVRSTLQRLVNTYENPLARQKVLDQVRHTVIFSH